jgi:hypothetical protein
MKKILCLLGIILPVICVAQTLKITGQSNQTYNGGNYKLIVIKSSQNITITNFNLTGPGKTGITIYGSDNVNVNHCNFTALKFGVYCDESTHLKIDNNNIHNITGGPTSHGIQFDNSTGEIIGNTIVSDTGTTNPGDLINVYESVGTAASPITVQGNYIKGGGPNRSSSGIQVDQYCAYVNVTGNSLINPGSCGISSYLSDHITFTKNNVCSGAFTWSCIGMYVETTTHFTASGNNISWLAKNGQEFDYMNTDPAFKWTGNNLLASCPVK